MPPDSGRADHGPRVDRELEGGEEQVVLGAEVVVHQRRVHAGVAGDRPDRRTPRSPAPRSARAPRPGSPPGCRVLPGRRPRRTGLASRRRHRRSARGRTPATRAGRARAPRGCAHLRVLISTTISPPKPERATWREELGGADRAAARAPGARPWPSRCRRSGGCAAAGRRAGRPSRPGRSARSRRARGRWWCWRSPRSEGSQPGRYISMPRRRRGPPGVHVLDRERDAGRLLEGGDARRRTRAAYSFCQRNGGCTTTTSAPTAAAISADRSSLPHGSVPQTRWVNSRHGACTAQTGISWCSESCWTAEICWLSASMPTITSTAS